MKAAVVTGHEGVGIASHVVRVPDITRLSVFETVLDGLVTAKVVLRP